jgi:hypothetical protein
VGVRSAQATGNLKVLPLHKPAPKPKPASTRSTGKADVKVVKAQGQDKGKSPAAGAVGLVSIYPASKDGGKQPRGGASTLTVKPDMKNTKGKDAKAGKIVPVAPSTTAAGAIKDTTSSTTAETSRPDTADTSLGTDTSTDGTADTFSGTETDLGSTDGIEGTTGGLQDGSMSSTFMQQIAEFVAGIAQGISANVPANTEPQAGEQTEQGSSVPEDPDMKVCLEAHNLYRKDFGSDPLEWDSLMSKNATLSAQKLLEADRPPHSATDEVENIFRGNVSVNSCQEAVDAWHQESEMYTDEQNSQNTGTTAKMMSKSTIKMGCGMAKNDQHAIYVCHYDPVGEERDVKLEEN